MSANLWARYDELRGRPTEEAIEALGAAIRRSLRTAASEEVSDGLSDLHRLANELMFGVFGRPLRERSEDFRWPGQEMAGHRAYLALLRVDPEPYRYMLPYTVARILRRDFLPLAPKLSERVIQLYRSDDDAVVQHQLLVFSGIATAAQDPESANREEITHFLSRLVRQPAGFLVEIGIRQGLSFLGIPGANVDFAERLSRVEGLMETYLSVLLRFYLSPTELKYNLLGHLADTDNEMYVRVRPSDIAVLRYLAVLDSQSGSRDHFLEAQIAKHTV